MCVWPAGMGDMEALSAVELLQTGEDAVAFFTRFGPTCPVKFVYLNRAETGDDFRPYDLVVVPQEEVNAEHFTMSASGVVHISTDGPSEFISLLEWMRQSSRFNVISSMCVSFAGVVVVVCLHVCCVCVCVCMYVVSVCVCLRCVMCACVNMSCVSVFGDGCARLHEEFCHATCVTWCACMCFCRLQSYVQAASERENVPHLACECAVQHVLPAAPAAFTLALLCQECVLFVLGRRPQACLRDERASPASASEQLSVCGFIRFGLCAGRFFARLERATV